MNTNKQLYLHFLDQLKEEISLYKNEEDLWKLAGGITNTPGNLCLHICGNLNNYLGEALGKTGYIRNRPLEFSKKNVSREELMDQIDETKSMIEKVFDGLTPQRFDEIYPLDDFGGQSTIGFEISRLISHMAYHVGQINYHRRALDL
ncbi:MAG: DinB family protein [Ignavibacteria bacterium]